MQVDQNDDADRRGSEGSDPGGSGSTPQLSSKLRDKLQKLAKWRIDSSSIEFPKDGLEFRGGFATVSRAFLVSTSESESSEDDWTDTDDDATDPEDENESHDKSPRRKAIAVKKLKIENGKDKEEVLGLALREAGFLTELSHGNVIELEGFVEDLSEDRVWLVFPWADNGNLKDFVASADWEIPERIYLINDVARGVEYLHNQNLPIYHGDLKSANILVNSKCRAVITDFGSARRLTKKDPSVQPEKSGNGTQAEPLLETEFNEATNTITLKGNQYTLRWAPPELLKDDEPGLWSDIWALGWVFYEVMTNSIPFQNVRKDSVVFIHVIQGNLPSVADHTSMVLMRALYSLMITCWSIDPSKRPTAEDCRKSMTHMPMISPDRQRAANTTVSRTRSPELLTKMAYMHRLRRDYISASKLLTEALGICEETGDNAGKAEALFGLARVNRGQNNYSEAVRLYTEVVQIYTDTGNRQRSAHALAGLAGVHRLQHKYNEAVTFYCEVVEICTKTGDQGWKADALWGLAEVHRLQNEYSKAVTLYTEAAQIHTDIGNRQGRAAVLVGLADVHRAQNEYSKAVPLFSEVVQICTDLGNRQGRAEALWGLAEVHRLQKQYSQAVKLFSEALQIYIDIGNRYWRALALRSLADVHRDQDQHEDAIRLYEQAAGIFEEIGHTQEAEYALNRAADSGRKLKPAVAFTEAFRNLLRFGS